MLVRFVPEEFAPLVRPRVRREGLDHTEAEGSAADAAAREAQRGAVEAVERLVKLVLPVRARLAILDIAGVAGDAEPARARVSRRAMADFATQRVVIGGSGIVRPVGDQFDETIGQLGLRVDG